MILLILGIALVLRLIAINQSLWLDEAINVLAVRDYPFVSVILDYTKADFHPPGYTIFLWVWTNLFFGFSEVSVRVPSIIFGLITIYCIYLIGTKLHSQKLGLLAAFILAINPLHIYYSQEARMYSLAAMAVSANYYFLLNFLEKRRWASIGYIISLLLIFSADYLAHFVLVAQLWYVVWFYRVKVWNWLTTIAVTVVLWSWWLWIFKDQLLIGLTTASVVPGWNEVVGSSSLKALLLTYVKFLIGRISHPNDQLYLMLFLPIGLLFAGLMLLAFLKAETKVKMLVVSWLSVPILVTWLLSFWVPIFSYFRVLFALPALILLVALGILYIPRHIQKLALILVVAFQLGASLLYLSNSQFHREDWKGLVQQVGDAKSGELVLIESSGLFAPLQYYNKPSVSFTPSLKNFPAGSPQDLQDLDIVTQGRQKVYLIEYLVEISDPQRLVQKQLESQGYKLSKIENFRGIGHLYEYQK